MASGAEMEMGGASRSTGDALTASDEHTLSHYRAGDSWGLVKVYLCVYLLGHHSRLYTNHAAYTLSLNTVHPSANLLIGP